MNKNLLLVSLFILIISCSKTKDKPIATIDNKAITYTDIDNILEKQLFHILEGIYIMRRDALNEYINEYILETEAKKQNMRVEELLDKNVMCKITDSLIEHTITKLKGFVPDRTNPYKIYDCKTNYGMSYLKKSLLIDEKNKYINELKRQHKIKIFIKPPHKVRPSVNLNKLNISYKGNKNSKHSFILIGNYDCDGCLQAKSIVDYLYDKYNKKMKFSFCYYNYGLDLSSIATIAADKQGKYWEMHEKLLLKNNKKDTAFIIKCAENLDLDLETFKNDLKSIEIKTNIRNNINIIIENKITHTPTIVIDNKVFNAPFIKKDIEDFIDNL